MASYNTDIHVEMLILSTDNKDWRLQEAQRNWQRAGDYAQNILEERRDKFWQSFAEYAKDFS
jgi:hypothetical protein